MDSGIELRNPHPPEKLPELARAVQEEAERTGGEIPPEQIRRIYVSLA